MVSRLHARAGSRDEKALADLLVKGGSAYDIKDLRELLKGVLAAPPGMDEAAWTRLVAPEVSPALEAELLALAADMAAARPTQGAGANPAARLAALRGELRRRGVGGMLVPRADEHQGEY